MVKCYILEGCQTNPNQGSHWEATERPLMVLVFFEDTQLFEKGERSKEQVFLAPLLQSTQQVKSLHLVRFRM